LMPGLKEGIKEEVCKKNTTNKESGERKRGSLNQLFKGMKGNRKHVPWGVEYSFGKRKSGERRKQKSRHPVVRDVPSLTAGRDEMETNKKGGVVRGRVWVAQRKV